MELHYGKNEGATSIVDWSMSRRSQGGAMDEWATLQGLGLADARLSKLGARGNFLAEDGVVIQFCHFRQENATDDVLLLTGWDESFLKYGEVISELLDAKFNVYTMDWRSQGLSGRLLLDPQLTYVKRFDDYLRDLRFFVDKVVVGECGVDPAKLTCLAHSMGAFIALLALADGWGSSKFRRLVACSPMIRAKMGMPHALARWLGIALCWAGMGEMYAPGQKAIEVSKPITSRLTTDKGRLNTWERIRQVFPLITAGGVSTRWVLEAVKAEDRFEAQTSNIDIPVLLLEAEIDDYVCTTRPFRKLAKSAAECKIISYLQTYHEILFERNWARAHAMKATLAFLQSGAVPAEQVSVVSPPVSDQQRSGLMGMVRSLVEGRVPSNQSSSPSKGKNEACRYWECAAFMLVLGIGIGAGLLVTRGR